MNALAGLAVLGLVGGGLFLATKNSKASGGQTAGSFEQVQGQSGTSYMLEFLGSRQDDTGTIDIYAIHPFSAPAGVTDTRILVFQQYRGDNSTRIWDKLAGGLPSSDPSWQTAAADFGVFVSV